MQSKSTLRKVAFCTLLGLALGTAQIRAAEVATAAEAPAAPAAIAEGSAILAPPQSDLERRLFDQVHDGRFGRFSLLEAGLIAGGIDDDEQLQRYCRRFDALAESLRASDKVQGEPRAQAQAIFEFLHRSVLCGGYCLQASDLRQAFDHGRFNCVTATLLLNCLAERFGLNAVALQFPGHAMSRLELPSETLDIETTCPAWFTLLDGGHKAQRGGDSRLPESKAAKNGPPRLLTEVELVATIYYNRGVDLLAERRFAEAVAANGKAVRLDPQNATAKGNYLATINNWGIELGMAGQYEKAAELFRLGMTTDPTYDTFRVNYVRLFRQWNESRRKEAER